MLLSSYRNTAVVYSPLLASARPSVCAFTSHRRHLYVRIYPGSMPDSKVVAVEDLEISEAK